jgi:hypothetical protein
MLILYLVSYLLSNRLILSQGNFLQLLQNFKLFFFNSLQFLILQFTRLNNLFSSLPLQPGHLFFSLRCALQTPQFIPQGAIYERVFAFQIKLLCGNSHRDLRNYLTNTAADSAEGLTDKLTENEVTPDTKRVVNYS